MQITPYLNFNGNCADAFRFYEKVLDGKIAMMMTHAETPMASQSPPELQNAIMHARLEVGDMVVMGSDAPGAYFQKPQGFSVSIGVDDPAKADRIFKALSENGEVRMPIQETFWALRFGMLVDQYGTPWMVNCERPA